MGVDFERQPGRATERSEPLICCRVEAVLRKSWQTRLGVQVDMLPGFEDCFRDVKQLLGDFDRLRATEVSRSPR